MLQIIRIGYKILRQQTWTFLAIADLSRNELGESIYIFLHLLLTYPIRFLCEHCSGQDSCASDQDWLQRPSPFSPCLLCPVISEHWAQSIQCLHVSIACMRLSTIGVSWDLSCEYHLRMTENLFMLITFWIQPAIIVSHNGVPSQHWPEQAIEGKGLWHCISRLVQCVLRFE